MASCEHADLLLHVLGYYVHVQALKLHVVLCHVLS